MSHCFGFPISQSARSHSRNPPSVEAAAVAFTKGVVYTLCPSPLGVRRTTCTQDALHYKTDAPTAVPPRRAPRPIIRFSNGACTTGGIGLPLMGLCAWWRGSAMIIIIISLKIRDYSGGQMVQVAMMANGNVQFGGYTSTDIVSIEVYIIHRFTARRVAVTTFQRHHYLLVVVFDA